MTNHSLALVRATPALVQLTSVETAEGKLSFSAEISVYFGPF